MELIEALHELDHLNDDHWTIDGLPKLQAVHEAIGHDKTVRKDITNLVPDFNRDLPLQVSDGIKEDSEGADILDLSQTSESEVEVPVGQEAPVRDPNLLAHLVNELKDGIAEIDTKLQKAVDARVALHEKTIKLNAERDELVLELEDYDPKMTNQQAISTFIKSQNAQKMERHNTGLQALKDINIEDIETASALDKAMARRTGRGNQRPARSV